LPKPEELTDLEEDGQHRIRVCKACNTGLINQWTVFQREQVGFFSMEQQCFYIVIDYKGRQLSDKAISMPLKSIYNKSFCFNEQRCIFKHGRKLPQSCPLNLLLYFI
jgi:hypothetical protein